LQRRVDESGRESEVLALVQHKFVQAAQTLMKDALKINKDE
jgi:hypothetical protein